MKLGGKYDISPSRGAHDEGEDGSRGRDGPGEGEEGKGIPVV